MKSLHPTPGSSRPPYAAEQLTLFTQQGRLHDGQPVAQWVLGEIERLDMPGATLVGGLIGRGHDGITHAVTLFDDAEQPVQIVVVAPSGRIDELLAALGSEAPGVFYTRMPVTAGVL